MKIITNLALTLCVLVAAPFYVIGNGLYVGCIVAGRTAQEVGEKIRWIWTR